MVDIEDRQDVPGSLGSYMASAKESITVFTWVWRHLQTPEERKKTWIMFIAMFINIAIQIGVSATSIYVIDGLNGKNIEVIAIGLSFTALFNLLPILFHYIQATCREWILGFQRNSLDDYITKKLFEKSLGQHIQHSDMLNVSNIDKGRWKLLDLQGTLLFEGFSVLMNLGISYIATFFISFKAGCILLVALVPNVLWTMFLNHRVLRDCTSIDKDWRAHNRRLVERWVNVERVKTCGKEDDEREELNEEFRNIISRDRPFWLWFIAHASFRDITNVLGLLSVFGYASYAVYHNLFSIGTFFPLIMWAGNITRNIWQIGRIEHVINWNMPAVKAKIEALRLVPDVVNIPGARVIDRKEPISITFDSVSYIYPNNDTENDDLSPALRDISFHVGAGEKVALIGQSGVGKSTIHKLAMRFMDPTSGRVLINGHDLREIDLTSWMHAIGYIPQEPKIFDGTLKYNLIYPLSRKEQYEITDEEIESVMKELKIDFGKRLGKGMYTQVGERGVRLSGGQVQRVAIGAAAIKKPTCMLIDEATSSLDSKTEQEVQKGLEKLLSGNTTAVIIAHRLSTVENLCQKFVVLKDSDSVINGESQVEAIGSSFTELLDISPQFRILAKAQRIIVS